MTDAQVEHVELRVEIGQADSSEKARDTMTNPQRQRQIIR